MMGLQATATKRKYEIGACGEFGDIQANCSPVKASRWTLNNTTNQPNTSCPSTTNNGLTKTTNATSVISAAPPPPSSPATVTVEDSIAKLEAVTVPGEPWGAEPIVDSISRLQAVAVPTNPWGSDGNRSVLATTLLNADDLDDDEDDFDDDFDEDDSIIPSYSNFKYPCTTPPPRNFMSSSPYGKPNYYSEPYPQQNCSRTPSQYAQRPPNGYGWNNSYYSVSMETMPSQQQTIRCAENGKSYLELGSSTTYGSNLTPLHNGSLNGALNSINGARTQKQRCCDGRSGIWCNSKQCYRERRHKMRNLSMFKLSRFRQVSEQSLYRSVLICNTLKMIDREIEIESKEMQTTTMSSEYHSQHVMHYNNSNNNGPNRITNNIINGGNNVNGIVHNGPEVPSTTQANSNNTNSNNSDMQMLHSMNSTVQPQNQFSSSDNSINVGNTTTISFNGTNRMLPTLSSIMSLNDSLPPYDHHPLMQNQSGRATPFPLTNVPDTDSGYGDEDCTRPINWGSVLSLSSQSALDPLNNNDLFPVSTTVTSATIAPTTAATVTIQSANTNVIAALTTSASATSANCITTINNVTSVTATGNSHTLTASAIATSVSQTNWEYNLLDMDLGLGPELTELLPSWKLTPLSADDILKSVPPPMEPSKVVLENDMDTLTHIMVGS